MLDVLVFIWVVGTWCFRRLVCRRHFIMVLFTCVASAFIVRQLWSFPLNLQIISGDIGVTLDAFELPHVSAHRYDDVKISLHLRQPLKEPFDVYFSLKCRRPPPRGGESAYSRVAPASSISVLKFSIIRMFLRPPQQRSNLSESVKFRESSFIINRLSSSSASSSAYAES